MPPRLRSRSFKLMFLSFNENFGMFITHLLCVYISVFILCPHVNVLCCAYMTNLLFIHKVKVTERKHLTQKQNVSSSLRVFVQNLLNLFTMFFNVDMRMFCFSLYMTYFHNCIQSGGQGHRKKVAQNAYYNVLFSYSRLYLPTHCSSNVTVPGFYSHLLQCRSKTITILQQSISNVKVKAILGEIIVRLKMIIFRFFRILYIYILS